MLHPDTYRPAYADYLATELAPRVDQLVGGAGRHSLFGLLGHGGGEAVRQGWHRDFVRPGFIENEFEMGTPAEARFLAASHALCCQLNAPLLPGDRFLQLVPGSHRRASTPAEIAAGEAGAAAEMPGARTVAMEPGDIALYDPNLWHRGWNPEGRARWTVPAWARALESSPCRALHATSAVESAIIPSKGEPPAGTRLRRASPRSTARSGRSAARCSPSRPGRPPPTRCSSRGTSRARSHRRFVLPLIHFMPDSLR